MNQSYTDLLKGLHQSVVTEPSTLFERALAPHPRLSARQQLNIYHEGYHARLHNTVTADFPALAHYLGELQFNDLVAAFVQHTPSNNANLDVYPLGFAQFIHEYLNESFALELAELEATIMEVFLAKDSPTLDVAQLSGLTETEFAQSVLIPRTALRLLVHQYAVNDYLSAFRDARCRNDEAADCFPTAVVRHPREVHRYPLSVHEYALLQRLYQGLCVQDALDEWARQFPLQEETIALHLSQWFQQWVQHGFFQSLTKHTTPT